MEIEVNNQAKTFDGGITAEQIDNMKEKYRKVFRVDIVDGEDTHIGYFKRPDFATIKAITRISKTDEVEAGKVLFENCWLGGSPELRQDAVLFMAVQSQLCRVVTGCALMMSRTLLKPPKWWHWTRTTFV